MRTARLLLVLLLGLLLITACSDGDDGADGLMGPEGPAGEPGTANVIFSEWTNFSTTWRDTSIDGSALIVNDIAAPSLTQENLDTAAIFAYVHFSSTYAPLPYTSYAGFEVNTVSFLPAPGRMFYTRFGHDNTSPNVSSSVYFRYIVVPGGQAEVLSKSIGDRSLEDLSYTEICARLGIPE